MKRQYIWIVIVLLISFVLVGCNGGSYSESDSADEPDSSAFEARSEQTVQRTLNEGITGLGNQPNKWRSVLTDIVTELENTSPDVSSNVETLLNDTEALVSAQPACATGELGKRVRENLIYIRDGFLGRETTHPAPWVCSFTPSRVDLKWNSGAWWAQVPAVKVYGLNFQEPNSPRVEIQYPDGLSFQTTDVEVIRQSPYMLYLNLHQLHFPGEAQVDVSGLVYGLSLKWPTSVSQQSLNLVFIPPEFQVNVKIILDSIYVIDEADGSGNAEPYLWPVFFKLDKDTLDNLYNPENIWVYGPGGAHKNIGGSWDAGNYIPIPPYLGQWQTTLRGGSPWWPPKDRIAVAVLVVLLEEDDLPSSASIANEHYPAFVKEVTRQIQCEVRSGLPEWLQSLNEFLRPMSCPTPLGSSAGTDITGQVEREIETQLKGKLQAPWAIWLLGPFAAAANVDDFIGAGLFLWTWEDLERQPEQTFVRTWDESTGSEDGAFTLYGRIYTQIVPQ